MPMQTTIAVLTLMIGTASAGWPPSPSLRFANLWRSASAAPPYETRHFDQRLDHFGFRSGQKTWRQKYLVNDTYWGGPGHPILFYTGNEGPIEAFYHLSGFVTEVLAPKLKGLIVFAEQRFYGTSMPFGLASMSPDALSYLSTEQVLADYAHLLTTLKAQLNATSSKVVSFGGSYGGTLSTIFRCKYPHIVVGALAASAPIGYYSPTYWKARGVDEFTWFSTVERVYRDAGCYDQLVRAVRTANSTARDDGPAVAKAFGLCAPPTEVDAFVYWITEALESLPQVDYQDAGSPVNATCRVVQPTLSGSALLVALANVTRTYYGLPPVAAGAPCTPERLARNVQDGGGTPGDGPAPASSWGYQSCTETLHAFSVPSAGWRSFRFSADKERALCQRYYNVTPDQHRLETWAGGYAISEPSAGHSNIIWSNGRRDPWHGGGFLRASDALPGGAVFVMDETAHHQDLRKPAPTDPAELTRVRAQEEAIIRGWLGM